MEDIYILSQEGKDFCPATKTDAVGHDQMKTSLTKLLTTYNVSSIWPEKGLSGSNQYSLELAVKSLDESLTDSQKVFGVRLGFLNEDGRYEEWEFSKNYGFGNTTSWERADSRVISEISDSVFPVTISFSMMNSTSPSDNELAAIGTTTNFVFSWAVYKKGSDITNDTAIYFNGNHVDSTQQGRQVVEAVFEREHVIKRYELTATYQGQTSSDVKEVIVVHPCYYGILPDTIETPTEEQVKAMSVTKLKNTKAYQWPGIKMTYSRICYAYPKYHGALTSIKDSNGLEYLKTSYNRSELTIDGEPYYVYTTMDPVTVSDYEQIFS